MIIQRTWRDDGGTVSHDQLVSIHEVRGSGRARYMLRPWGSEPDGQGGWNIWADNASALWTVYDGDEPTADYRMIDHPTLGTVPYPENSYTLGLAQRTPAGDVKYFHTDHLGTTQAMTDASQAVDPRIVYTAFGEVIRTVGTAHTRYQYAGGQGYESFAEIPFMHVGARWYDPASGRFLQRDLIGIRGGLNVYEYVRSVPVSHVDVTGYVPEVVTPWPGGQGPWGPNATKEEKKAANKAAKHAVKFIGYCGIGAFGGWVAQLGYWGYAGAVGGGGMYIWSLW